jgi:beta-lactamase regulating signal transducer with metallopeptidase domain
MFETLGPGGSLGWDYLWQSTLLLGFGLATSAVMARRPARAHRFLLLAILAALITPVLAATARRGGWGLLSDWTESRASASAPASASVNISLPPSALVHATLSQASGTTRFIGPRVVGTDEIALRPERSNVERYGPRSVTLRTLVFGGWLSLSGLAVVRLVSSLFLGMRLLRRARPTNDSTLTAAVVMAGSRLGVIRVPELRSSPRMRCPTIWCWTRRPVIVLPEEASAASSVEWVGVFCHELAHWVRRDHLSSLFAEVLVCALPWHPLAWYARHRLGRLSELACDDWVLATGLPAAEYAESLLGLVPQRGASLALAAVSSERGLFGRIQHIMDERRSSPFVGNRWAFLSAVAMVLAASALALAQNRPSKSTAQSAEPNDDLRSVYTSKSGAETREEIAMKHTIRGTVQRANGQTIEGATVLLVAYTKPPVHRAMMPRDRQDQQEPRDVILAKTDTGAGGRYLLPANIDPNGFDSLQVVALASGFGLDSIYLKKYDETLEASQLDTALLTHRLLPQVAIHGRLLTPSGLPASGVRVTLNSFFKNDGTGGMHVGMTPTDAEVPSYWPKPSLTDADGRFNLVGVAQGMFASLTFWHSDYAVDEVAVSTTGDDSLSPSLRAVFGAPVKPTFTHTLEPARPVQGRVTDNEIGKPLAGMLVELLPMRPQQGGRSFFTRTDADGHYRISGHAGAWRYITTVYPPANSGYLVASDSKQGWPAGARFLEMNFALAKGRIFRGRVIDADSKRPVASAAVFYRARPDNPNSRNNARGESPVLADADGRFTVTGLPGEGDLLVEATSEYIRTAFEPGGRNGAFFPHGHAHVSVPPKGETAPVDIAVRKGVTFESRVAGPDGKPVSTFAAYCPEMSGVANYRAKGSLEFHDGRLIFPGADPDRTYKVILVSARHQLAAVVEIKPDPKAAQPLEIRLQPTARVHGRVVNPSGTPMSDGQVYAMIALRGEPRSMSRNDILTDTEFYSNLLEPAARVKHSDEPGVRDEFTHDSLVPGLPFYIGAESGGRQAVHYVPPLAPGEDRDVGTVTLKERQR